MTASTSPTRYTTPAIALHWLHAGLIVGLLVLGYLLSDLPKGPERSGLIALHKSFGLCALAVWLLRAGWRWRHTPPALLVSGWEVRAAEHTHRLLYLLTLLVPLAGYLSASFTKYPMKLFIFAIPKAGWPDDAINAVFNALHRGGAWLLAGVIALHIAGALLHAWRRDGTLLRMMPGRPGKPGSP